MVKNLHFSKIDYHVKQMFSFRFTTFPMNIYCLQAGGAFNENKWRRKKMICESKNTPQHSKNKPKGRNFLLMERVQNNNLTCRRWKRIRLLMLWLPSLVNIHTKWLKWLWQTKIFRAKIPSNMRFWRFMNIFDSDAKPDQTKQKSFCLATTQYYTATTQLRKIRCQCE